MIKETLDVLGGFLEGKDIMTKFILVIDGPP